MEAIDIIAPLWLAFIALTAVRVLLWLLLDEDQSGDDETIHGDGTHC